MAGGYKLDEIKVLVVDDNKYMRHLFRTLLMAFGIERIVEAEDGGEAFDKLCEDNIDLVICDLVMEPIDGFEFVRRVRHSDESPDPFVPIIIVSGYTERFRVKEARDYGVTEVLAKPISSRELARRIKSVIEHPRPFIKTANFFGPDRRRRKDSNLFYSGEERRMNKFSVEDQIPMDDYPPEADRLDDSYVLERDDKEKK